MKVEVGLLILREKDNEFEKRVLRLSGSQKKEVTKG
jgi:hypothetical protein